MLMKVARTLTSKLVLYYSMTGNTKAIATLFGEHGFEVKNILHESFINFYDYDVVVIGTSTWGRGLPPKPFFKIRDQLARLEGKSIGLFGSGRSEYEFFCGALDLIEELVKNKNNILFKYKYEGYPRYVDFMEMERIINEQITEV